MREYGQDYWAVLKWPLRTFWSMNRQISRLRAEDDQRVLRVHSAVEDPNAVKSLNEDLNAQIQTPVVIEKKFDADGFASLQKRLGTTVVSSE